MNRSNQISLLLAAVAAALGCASCAAAAQKADPARGKTVYERPIKSARGDLPSCAKCHPSVAGAPMTVSMGINLHDIALKAGQRVQGQSAEDYLRASIVDPDAFLAEGFQDGLMSREYKQLLTPQEIEDLVAYMMTLKN